MSEPDVLVIGESLIDIVDDGMSPTEHVGGSPANVALGLGRRGVATALLTQLADDARGRAIVEHLTASRVEVLPQSVSAARTSTAVARIAPDGQADYEFDVSWTGFDPPAVAPRLVHTGSIAAFVEPGASSVRAVLEQTRALEVTFDPNIRPALLPDHATTVAAFERLARLSTVVKMSDQDAEWLYPHAGPDDIIDAVVALGPRLVVLTRGADGAVIATPTARVSIPAVSVIAVDTIGAGDTFMASLIHSVLELGSAGLDHDRLVQIGTIAARAASITVSRAGANLPWADELEPMTPVAGTDATR